MANVNEKTNEVEARVTEVQLNVPNDKVEACPGPVFGQDEDSLTLVQLDFSRLSRRLYRDHHGLYLLVETVSTFVQITLPRFPR